MKILIAIDSFKGSISSIQGSEAISKGIKEVFPDSDILIMPLADGGEGTVDALVYATGGHLIEKEVVGPLGEKVNAMYGMSKDRKIAYIEVAAACGLPLLNQDELNTLLTTTYGVGEFIVDAMEKGCRDFIIGLGGSSTNDAGVGMLQALGFRFLGGDGEDVPLGGQGLSMIRGINIETAHPLLKGCTFQVACDVRNFLYGDNGAAYVFGPQKGASPDMVLELDSGLQNFAGVISKELGIDVQHIEGAGAAGGLGAAFTGLLNGKLWSGIDLLVSVINLEEKLQGVDIVVTGEGLLDGQTLMGKAPSGVAQIASKNNITVIAFAGGINQEGFSLNENGMTACFSIMNKPMSLEEAMDEDTTYQNLKFTSSQVFRLIKAVRKK